MKITIPFIFASAVSALYIHTSSYTSSVTAVSIRAEGSCEPSTVNITTTATVTVYASASALGAASSSTLSSLAAVSTGASSSALTPASVSSIVSASGATSTYSSNSSSPTLPSNTTSSIPISAQYQRDAQSVIATLAATYSNKTKVWDNLWGYQAATIYQDLMDYDYWTSTSSEESYGIVLLDIVTGKSLLDGVGATDDYNDDREWWMLAFLHAYRTYGHVELLNQAITMFDQVVASSQLSATDAGTTPKLGGVVRSVEIPKTCDVAGAVYWRQTADSSINAVSTGLIGHVGALLYSITKQEEYRQAADLAIDYERRQFLSSTGIMDVDSITTATCQKNGGSLCYNTGIYLAACTLLYQTTAEAKYLEWATLTANTSVNGVFGNEASAPLVVNQGGGSYDVFFRCLNEFYAMIKSENINPGLQGQIKTFVKANVDSHLASAQQGGFFSHNWLAQSPDHAWDLGGMLGVVMGAMIML